jgi:hypothetical protein
MAKTLHRHNPRELRRLPLLRGEGIEESRCGMVVALVGTRAQEEGADGSASGRGAQPAGPARTATRRVAWADFNTPRCTRCLRKARGLGKARARTPRVVGVTRHGTCARARPA